MNRRTMKAVVRKLALQTAEIRGRGEEAEIEIQDEREAERFMLETGLGGYRTGYGAWVLRGGYVGNGDYGDSTSRWHY